MDEFQFLNLRTKPLILDAEKAGWLYGWSREDVLLLCRRGHMAALANPPPGAQRYFSTKYLLSLSDDEKWLRKAITLLRENIAARNQAALRKLEKAGNTAAATAGSNRRPVPNAGHQREVVMRNPMAARRHPAGVANFHVISPAGVVFTGVAAVTPNNTCQSPSREASPKRVQVHTLSRNPRQTQCREG